jgi:hypothetical protein
MKRPPNKGEAMCYQVEIESIHQTSLQYVEKDFFHMCLSLSEVVQRTHSIIDEVVTVKPLTGSGWLEEENSIFDMSIL